MTNPNNAIGTNAAYGGRTSANAFNDVLAGFSRGVLSGWGCSPSSGLTVSLGGDGNNRDVAVAENNTGDKVSINNISNSPVAVTIGAAPASNSRIDAIVAYVDNPPQGTSTVADNPSTCGLIVVAGTAASTPTAPSDNVIRTAITADGASGTTAYYAVLAYVTIASGTTDISTNDIQVGDVSCINMTSYIPPVTGVEIKTNLEFDGATVYAQRFTGTANLVANTTKTITLINSGIDSIVYSVGWAKPGTNYAKSVIGTTFVAGNGTNVTISGGHYVLVTTSHELDLRMVYFSSETAAYDIVVYYTKL